MKHKCYTISQPQRVNPVHSHLLQFFFVASLAFSTIAVTAQWKPVGNTGFSAGYAAYSSLVISPDGKPTMAYKDDEDGRARVMQYNGSSWVAMGNAGFSVGEAWYISLAFSPEGTPYVAYCDRAYSGGLTVMKYNGSSWITVGSAGFSGTESYYTSIAFSPDGTPYVAYSDNTHNLKGVVMKYNGSSWVAIGNTGFSEGEASYNKLAFSPDGIPFVAYADGPSLTVRMYTGGLWLTVGDPGFSAGGFSSISLVFSPEGTPYVSYCDKAYSGRVTVMTYNGSSWITVGSAGFSAGIAWYTSLAFGPDGILYVGYSDDDKGGKATVMKYNGDSWIAVGKAGFSASSAGRTSLAISADGTLYLGYSDLSTNGKATVMSFHSITTQPLRLSFLCAGSAVDVPVTVTGNYNVDNVFTAQLSDAAGNFDNPTSIGTLSSTASGTIQATIPAGITPGNAYRIRVVSGSPIITGSDNGTDLTITAPSAPISGGDQSECAQNPVQTLTATATGNTITWYDAASGGNSVASPTLSTVGTVTYYAEASVGTCSGATRTPVTLIIKKTPTATISGGGTYCNGMSAKTTLTISVTGSGTINGNLSDGTPFNGTAPPTITVQINPTITTTYTIANLSDATCTAQPSDLSGSATVTVNPAVVATISGTTVVCQDASSPGITFSGSGGTAPYTFTYSINGITQPTVSDDGSGTITISAPTTSAGNYVYTLLSLQDNSATQCSQDITGQSATITVNALSTATISGTTTVCQNSTQPVVTFNGSGGTAPYTFTYSLNEGNTTTSGLIIKGNPATIAVSATTAGIYTYTLTGVQDASGCQQELSPQSVQVTVNTLPNANISTASMVTAASTGNTATVDNAGTGAVYNWTITNGTITKGAGTNSITYTAGISGSVSLSISVTGTAGCGPVSGGPVVVPITALPCPNPAITASWIVCASSTGNIATVTKVTGNKYMWTIINGTITTGAGTNSISYKAGSFGLVILSVTVTNASGQCSVSSGKYFVLISPLPIAAIAAPASVCASSTGNIAYVPGCGLGATYAWTISNGTITSGNNSSKITFTAGTSGSVTLSVTATNFAGCKSSSGSKLVTIAPYPVASVTAAASVCSGSSNNKASVASGGSGARYAWSIINGCITSGSSTNSITYTATKSGSVTLKVTVTNSSGCKATSANKTVTIIAAPNAVITSVPSLCAGSTGNTASVGSAGTGTAYAWTISGGTVTSGGGTGSIKYTAGASGYVTLTVTVTNSNGCKAGCSKRVTVVAIPAGAITSSSSVCGGSSGNIASVSSAGTGAKYAWTITNGTITSGGTTNSIRYTAGSSGAIVLGVAITNSAGCKATASKNVTITTTVPAFTQVAALCKNSTAPALPTRSTNGIMGNWSPSRISTSSVAITTYTFTPAAGQCASSTSMKITIKNCSALSKTDIVAGQAISTAVPAMDAVILPNPSENFFTLVIKGNRKEVAEVRILDVQGRWLDNFKLPTGGRIQFGGNYAHGTYIVQVLQGPDRKVLKAIKQ